MIVLLKTLKSLKSDGSAANDVYLDVVRWTLAGEEPQIYDPSINGTTLRFSSHPLTDQNFEAEYKKLQETDKDELIIAPALALSFDSEPVRFCDAHKIIVITSPLVSSWPVGIISGMDYLVIAEATSDAGIQLRELFSALIDKTKKYRQAEKERKLLLNKYFEDAKSFAKTGEINTNMVMNRYKLGFRDASMLIWKLHDEGYIRTTFVPTAHD